MEKLSLHDSLRIYLPGLFLSILVYLFVTGKADEISVVSLPALFVVLLVDKFYIHIIRLYTKRLLKKKLF